MLSSVLRLLRRHPLLCLPVFAADLLCYLLERLWPYARFWIAEHWPRPHSVLAGALPFDPSVGVNHGGLLATAIGVRLLQQALESALWFSAFVLIAASVHEEPGGIATCWRTAWLWLKSQLGSVLLFSSVAWIVFAAAELLVGSIFAQTSLMRHVFAGRTYFDWLSRSVLLLLCGVLGALAIRLLPNGNPSPGKAARMAALYTLAAVSVSQAIFLMAVQVTGPMEGASQRIAAQLITSLLADVPYVVLFLALGTLLLPRNLTPGALRSSSGELATEAL